MTGDAMEQRIDAIDRLLRRFPAEYIPPAMRLGDGVPSHAGVADLVADLALPGVPPSRNVRVDRRRRRGERHSSKASPASGTAARPERRRA